jgi:hypothetical protein
MPKLLRARRSTQSLGLVRRIADIIGATLMSGVLAGCVPAMIRRSPAVSGIVRLDGMPLVAATVFVQSDANAACSASPLHAATDAQGGFAIPVGRSFEWYSPIQLGDRGYGWRLCFEYQGRSYLGYYETGWGTAAKKARLECELAAEAPATMSGVHSPLSCKLREP